MLYVMGDAWGGLSRSSIAPRIERCREEFLGRIVYAERVEDIKTFVPVLGNHVGLSASSDWYSYCLFCRMVPECVFPQRAARVGIRHHRNGGDS